MNRRGFSSCGWGRGAGAGLWAGAAMLLTGAERAMAAGQSLVDHEVAWPTLENLWRVLSLGDYNTRLVVIGTMLLGLAAGVIGSFMLLRKRALMGDALSHATLPGIAGGFLFMQAIGGEGKSLPALLAGATISGVLGMLSILAIRRYTKLKEDAALGIVLSVYFGLGAAMLGVITRLPTGSQAGLENYILGKTASMVRQDVILIAGAAAATVALSLAFFKEFKLICFDQDYAASLGWPVVKLDVLMMLLVIAVTVIGLQAVGLILVIALLILPPTAARFWSENLNHMVIVSAGIGAISGFLGAAASALLPNLPAGATIVCVAAVFFVLSMVFGSSRGIIVRAVRHRSLINTIARQNLLRALFEQSSPDDDGRGGPAGPRMPVEFAEMLEARSWSPRQLRRNLRLGEAQGLVRRDSKGLFHLTEMGLPEAARVMRNHRLWELYLVAHADIAPSHVDRDADQIEHVLPPAMIVELENLLARDLPSLSAPPSPHHIAATSKNPTGTGARR